MSKIRIKNFGPIKEGYLEDDGWMDIKKVTVFIGDQGSGKSTVAKLISTFTWLEKALNRGDIQLSVGNDINKVINWQQISSYLGKEYEIEYVGDQYTIEYTLRNPWPIVSRTETGKYIVPQIMYVPADRNLVSVLSDIFNVKGLPSPLFALTEEFRRAQKALNGVRIDLPLANYSYEYDEQRDMSFVIFKDQDGKENRTNLSEASSGFQSLVPLFVVSRNLAHDIQADFKKENISINQTIRRNEEIAITIFNHSLSEAERTHLLNQITAKYHNKCFINIVEEPEQNLYPSSQRHVLNDLTSYANMNDGNKLIMTTHSPYIINYLTLAVKANQLINKIKGADKEDELKQKIAAIVPLNATVAPEDLAIYELKEGQIKKVEVFNGLPSDENYLNDELGETNELFAQLLEIQQEL